MICLSYGTALGPNTCQTPAEQTVFQQAAGKEREREKVNTPSTNSTFVRRQALADADIHAGQASPD